MAKKSSKKLSQKTGCKKRCKGVILKSGGYCPCLERSLPSLGTHVSVDAMSLGFMERLVATLPEGTTERERGEVKARIREYGISEAVAELVVARYFESLSFPELVKTLGWVSVDSASYHLRQALKTLRERKFKL